MKRIIVAIIVAITALLFCTTLLSAQGTEPNHPPRLLLVKHHAPRHHAHKHGKHKAPKHPKRT